jgi:hypothetical protein
MDDTPVDKNSEAWRLECEARYVLGLKDKKSRTAYLGRIRTKRGDQAADILEGAVHRAWKLSKQETA